jgi:hypothetical protein
MISFDTHKVAKAGLPLLIISEDLEGGGLMRAGHQKENAHSTE